MKQTETIAAVATALSDSGIGIIRISGDQALQIGDRVYRSKTVSYTHLFQENFGIQCDDAFFKDFPFYDRFNSEFHIVCGQLDFSFRGVNEDAFENGHGGFIGHGLGYNQMCIRDSSYTR